MTPKRKLEIRQHAHDHGRIPERMVAELYAYLQELEMLVPWAPVSREQQKERVA